jgi:hypothetical protein
LTYSAAFCRAVRLTCSARASDTDLDSLSAICSFFFVQIWSELNKARSNPKAFANYLRSLEACYSGNVFTFQVRSSWQADYHTQQAEA